MGIPLHIISFITTVLYVICESEDYVSFHSSLTEIYPAYDYIRNSHLLKNLIYKIPVFSLKIGTPPKEYNFTISTELYLTWLADASLSKTFIKSPLYNTSESSSFHKGTDDQLLAVHFNSKKMNGTLNSDLFIYDGRYNFTFVLVNHTDELMVFKLSGIIGIIKGYSGNSVYNKYQNSFMSVLEGSGLITKRKFSFDFSRKNSSFHYVTFGKTYTNMSYCDSNFRYLDAVWYCDLYGISYGDKNYSTSELLYFESAIPYITLSDRLGEEVFEGIKKKHPDCYFRESEDKVQFVICEESYSELIKEELVFTLGTITVPIKIKDFIQGGFYDEATGRGKYYLLKIFREFNVDSSTFGAIAFKNRIVTFDLDNHAIGFSKYFEDDIAKVNDYTQIKKNIMTVCTIIEVISLLQLIYIHYLNRTVNK